MENIWNDISNFFSTTGLKILLVVCLLILGGMAISYLVKALKNLLYRTSMDDSIVSFVASLLKIVLWVVLILVLAGVLNLSASSLIVCLSSLALAVGLALKDSFANLANGLFIIYNKPFKRGDLVNIGGVEGKVQNIKLLNTELVSLDNRKLIIPNSLINSESIINYYAMPTRRVDKVFSVAYGTDANLTLAVIKEVLANNEMVLKYPESIVFMSSHSSSSVDFTIWAWVSTEDYWPFWCIIQQEIYEGFYKYGISIPFPQVDVHFDEKNKKPVKYPLPDNYAEIVAGAKSKEERIKALQENERQKLLQEKIEYLQVLESIKRSSNIAVKEIKPKKQSKKSQQKVNELDNSLDTKTRVVPDLNTKNIPELKTKIVPDLKTKNVSDLKTKKVLPNIDKKLDNIKSNNKKEVLSKSNNSKIKSENIKLIVTNQNKINKNVVKNETKKVDNKKVNNQKIDNKKVEDKKVNAKKVDLKQIKASKDKKGNKNGK